jgi:hypothetical protein
MKLNTHVLVYFKTSRENNFVLYLLSMMSIQKYFIFLFANIIDLDAP